MSTKKAALKPANDARPQRPKAAQSPGQPVPASPDAAFLADLPFDPWLPFMSTLQIAHACGPEAANQHRTARAVLAARGRIEGGDGAAVLFAVVQCVEAGLVAPDWLAQAFLRCYDTVMEAKAASWDDVFGAPWRGKDLRGKRQELELAAPIVRAVEEAWAKGGSKSEALFAAVAQRLGLTAARGSYCKKIYYRWRDHFPGLMARAAVERETRKHNALRKPSTTKKKSV